MEFHLKMDFIDVPLDSDIFRQNSGYLAENPGEVEKSYRIQIDSMKEAGYLDETHTGLISLVLKAARAVDDIKPSDAASGRAQLFKALNDIADKLPRPAEQAHDPLQKLTEVLDSVMIPMPADPREN
jgi:hypothetical protein|nr:MAG TPA: hypothetical protein [Caudoviricetes sp.]